MNTATQGYSLVVIGLVFVVVGGINESAIAQRKAHYLFNARQPTGEIGRAQLLRRPELRNYFQPVRVTVPRGAVVAVAQAGIFDKPDVDAMLVGLQVGQVYRLKVSDIPHRGRVNVYPTIELLDRMHPPGGKETRYPIPIEITAEDLALALTGKYVTRVVYVEDPQAAVAARDVPEQRYFEVLPTEDPLVVASELGRPVAILRMGTVTPGAQGLTFEFLFGAPPIERYAEWPAVEYVPSELDVEGIPVTPSAKNGPSSAVADIPVTPEERGAPKATESANITDDLPARETAPDAATDTDNIFRDDLGDMPPQDSETDEAEIDPFEDF